MKNCSTATNLLDCINVWVVGRTHVIYIDFYKTFDSKDTSKLLLKLESCNISGLILNWIKRCLSNRTQRVVVDHCCSPSSKVVSVPQESVLGPILFLVNINDTDAQCCGSTKLQLFADDTEQYSYISIDDTSACVQRSHDNSSAWASEWQKAVNIDKCTVLSAATKVSITSQAYSFNGLHSETS
jgi:ribonuclease P/MRP protein subunit RPP40